MHCVYLITFTKRKSLGIKPYLYIGSKSNFSFVDDKIYDKRGKHYWGSSDYKDYNSIIAEDDLVAEILHTSSDYNDILAHELKFQMFYDCVASLDFFNLSYAAQNNFSNPLYATYKHISESKTVRLPRNHPMVLSGEYVGVSKGLKLSDGTKIKMRRFGSSNPFYGKSHNDKTKAIIGTKNKGRVKSAEEIENWRTKVALLPMSDAHKKRISECNRGKVMLKNIETGKCIKIPKDKILDYDPLIWKNPASISQIRETCIYCGIQSTRGNIFRWHNNNCKEKHENH